MVLRLASRLARLYIRSFSTIDVLLGTETALTYRVWDDFNSFSGEDAYRWLFSGEITGMRVRLLDAGTREYYETSYLDLHMRGCGK